MAPPRTLGAIIASACPTARHCGATSFSSTVVVAESFSPTPRRCHPHSRHHCLLFQPCGGAPSPSRAATAAWELRLNRRHGESVLSMTLKGSHDSNPPLPSPPPLAPAAPRCHPRYRRSRCSLAARPQLSSRSPASRQAAAHQPLASRSPAVVSLSVSLCSFSLSHLSLGSGTPRRRFERRRRRRLGCRRRLRLRLRLCSGSGAGSGLGPGPKPLCECLASSSCVYLRLALSTFVYLCPVVYSCI